ncbi:entry exclusion lipoprotein TrbK [Pseudomonas sp. URMO17WK12:I11]|uniref:entry exclusion lipoprotein TrbK n=1 Tax=Pseudomonas sp. URMO17WK12:I11 TaxID=1283291 RepID=UPI0018D9678D|nr:entry exclusion lipoprotein TrbK [Pseudomonas sp. URMO17WK12:I11]MBH3361652.1 entry exclusion lipoprotein TrbK [Pseudomonas sp. URMO17WK12:I11]
MDRKRALLLPLVGLITLLGGCTEEKLPEPTADNCGPRLYGKNLASLSKDANRNVFIANCESFLAAKKMTEWKFEKSPKGKY